MLTPVDARELGLVAAACLSCYLLLLALGAPHAAATGAGFLLLPGPWLVTGVHRLVQAEAAARWGAGLGVLAGVVAWMVGHIREFTLYLEPQVGALEALGYLGVSGTAGALAYAKARHLGGLMLGHVLLNVLAGATAWFRLAS